MSTKRNSNNKNNAHIGLRLRRVEVLTFKFYILNIHYLEIFYILSMRYYQYSLLFFLFFLFLKVLLTHCPLYLISIFFLNLCTKSFLMSIFSNLLSFISIYNFAREMPIREMPLFPLSLFTLCLSTLSFFPW